MNKIRLSSRFFLANLIAIGVGSFFLISLLNDNKHDEEYDFKSHLEKKIGLAICVCVLACSPFIPKYYYDQESFFVERLGTKSKKIPLSKITSIFENPLSLRDGESTLELEYKNEEGDIKKLAFRIDRASKKYIEFISLVKRYNPSVEIV